MNNLTQRILTAVVAIPLILWFAITGGWLFFLFVSAISVVALRELYGLAAAKGAKPSIIGGAVSVLLLNCAFFHETLRTLIATWCDSLGMQIPFPNGDQLVVIVLVGAMVVLTLWELFRNAGSAILNLGSTAFGLIYVGLFLGSWIGIREMFTRTDPIVSTYFLTHGGVSDDALIYRAGGYMTVAIFAMIWACDSGAYMIGRLFGKHKLFPRVSPNKSWEGAVAGLAFSVAAAIGAQALVLGFISLVHATVIGALVGSAGQLGDLAESLLKRDAGVKDSSNLIPGHGGVLDRFDSLLLVAPVVYLYLDFVVF